LSTAGFAKVANCIGQFGITYVMTYIHACNVCNNDVKFPLPMDIKPRVLTLAINEEDTTASLPVAMEVAGYFDLKKPRKGR
jgi:predicted DCC family thiol-disulfide oxidoreductase YuxK